MSDVEQTKAELRALIDELVNALALGDEEPYARSIPQICRSLHLLGCSPEGKAAQYRRPFPTLREWDAFSVNGPSFFEQERRALVEAGWATETAQDRERKRLHAEQHAANMARDEERQRKRREEERVEVVPPLTRRAGMVFGR